ncbi:hypothetical protein ASF30_12310 [Leifsonia sp. Leaf264]|nr:hypothetical protein ASF30_12310 [Leifsonia sp. Leaf264]
MAGAYRVATASGSEYLIDIDGRTLTRLPSVGITDIELADPSSPLRRDGDAVQLFQLIDCTVGRPAQFIIGGLDANEGYAGTHRVTTTVTRIDELAAAELV